MTDSSTELVGITPDEIDEVWDEPPPDKPWLRFKITETDKPYVPDDRTAACIYRLACCGVPSGAIVNAVGISWSTIKTHYMEPLAAGKAEAEKLIARTPFKLAQDLDNPAVALRAAQYWLGVNHGWKEDKPAPEQPPEYGGGSQKALPTQVTRVILDPEDMARTVEHDPK